MDSINLSNAEATFFQNTRTQNFRKPSKPCHVGTHWIALPEYFQMSTHLPGFQLFLRSFASFCIGQNGDLQHKGLRVGPGWILLEPFQC